MQPKYYLITLCGSEDSSHLYMELMDEEASTIKRLGRLSKVSAKGNSYCPTLEIEVAE